MSNTSTEAYCVFPHPIEWWTLASQPWRSCRPLTQDDSTRRLSSLAGGSSLKSKAEQRCLLLSSIFCPHSFKSLILQWHLIFSPRPGTFLCWFSARSKAHSLVCALLNSFSRVKVFLRRFFLPYCSPSFKTIFFLIFIRFSFAVLSKTA